MLYSDLLGSRVSLLGFGTMRLPTSEGKIDFEATEALIDKAISCGVNYFDTAWPYHSGESELVTAKILKKYPRDTYYLASKYPGHQTADVYDPAEIFEKQLKKCEVEYFDFYLLHNVNENCIDVYRDKKWGIIDYFIKQKELGRIRHLGFSTHGGVKMISDFLDEYGEHMEFCQIQHNYLDNTLQDSKGKYELLTKYGIPVIVMEPVRGGKLAKLPKKTEAVMKMLRPGSSSASWAFRWLMNFPNVRVILSGMSDMSQLCDNIDTFSELSPLNGKECALLEDVARELKNTLPCTSCRYCTDVCPMGLDIPYMISIYNEMATFPSFMATMRLEGFPEEKLPSACISCGACSRICPQNIDVPATLASLHEMISKTPRWADICRERAAAQKQN
ncbi:MAG: aldo/keto reductase [Clostridia bacterium]|nr:aldo/keto reductase [Clostridia bacterium]